MADDIRTLDVTVHAGQRFINNPALFGSNILYLTRDGVGLVQITGSIPSLVREFSFRSSGIFAYKPLFFDAATSEQKIHIIYKV